MNPAYLFSLLISAQEWGCSSTRSAPSLVVMPHVASRGGSESQWPPVCNTRGWRTVQTVFQITQKSVKQTISANSIFFWVRWLRGGGTCDEMSCVCTSLEDEHVIRSQDTELSSNSSKHDKSENHLLVKKSLMLAETILLILTGFLPLRDSYSRASLGSALPTDPKLWHRTKSIFVRFCLVLNTNIFWMPWEWTMFPIKTWKNTKRIQKKNKKKRACF